MRNIFLIVVMGAAGMRTDGEDLGAADPNPVPGGGGLPAPIDPNAEVGGQELQLTGASDTPPGTAAGNEGASGNNSPLRASLLASLNNPDLLGKLKKTDGASTPGAPGQSSPRLKKVAQDLVRANSLSPAATSFSQHQEKEIVDEHVPPASSSAAESLPAVVVPSFQGLSFSEMVFPAHPGQQTAIAEKTTAELHAMAAYLERAKTSATAMFAEGARVPGLSNVEKKVVQSAAEYKKWEMTEVIEGMLERVKRKVLLGLALQFVGLRLQENVDETVEKHKKIMDRKIEELNEELAKKNEELKISVDMVKDNFEAGAEL